MMKSWATPCEGTFHDAPRTILAWQVGRCAISAFVLRDEPRVIIVGGEYGDSPARDADVVEVEALAERFNSVELKAAAARMRAKN